MKIPNIGKRRVVYKPPMYVLAATAITSSWPILFPVTFLSHFYLFVYLFFNWRIIASLIILKQIPDILSHDKYFSVYLQNKILKTYNNS